jgi:hypothetical protein
MKLLEADALRRDAVDVRRLRVLVAEAREVAPAHVVDEDHDDVRLRRGEQRTKGEEAKKVFEHANGNADTAWALHAQCKRGYPEGT